MLFLRLIIIGVCLALPAHAQSEASPSLESDALGVEDTVGATPATPEFSIEGSGNTDTATPAAAPETSEPVAKPEANPVAAQPEASPVADTRTLTERHREKSKHKLAIGVIFSHKAYRLADWRAAPVNRHYRSPRFMTLLLNLEFPILHFLGVTSLYTEAGVGGNFNKDGFSHLAPALIIFNAGLSYRARYVPRQWVVPYIKGAAEGVRHAYHFNHARIAGYRIMPRVEGGLELFLNAFDQSTAGDMYGNNKVIRTYLTGGYSMTFDNKKNHFDMSDRAWRFGIKVEL